MQQTRSSQFINQALLDKMSAEHWLLASNISFLELKRSSWPLSQILHMITRRKREMEKFYRSRVNPGTCFPQVAEGKCSGQVPVLEFSREMTSGVCTGK